MFSRLNSFSNSLSCTQQAAIALMKTVLIALIVFPFYGLAQQNSLKSNKELVDSLFFANQVEGLEISERMIPVALKENDTFHITYFLDQAGELNRMLGNYDKAITQISECLKYKFNWEDKRDLSLSYNNLGKTYVNRGQYDLAAKNFLKALEIMEKSDDLQGQAYYLNNLGALYDLQKNYSRALDYYERSLKVKEELKDFAGIASTQTNLGISYYNLGDYDKAVSSYNKAIKINLELNNPNKLARCYSNLGKVYIEMQAYNKAREALYRAYELRDQVVEASLKANLLNNLSSFYISTGDLDSARIFNDRVIEIPRDEATLKVLRDAYANAGKIAALQGNYELAYESLKTSILYDDSLVNEANIFAVAEMEGKYNYEKNRRIIQSQELEQLRYERKIQKTRSQLVYLFSGVIGLALLLIVLIVLYRSKRRKSALLEGQNHLIENQKKDLETLNKSISMELDQLQISMAEKERLLNDVFSSGSEAELPPELLSLSKREMEVLGYLALGRSDEEIAQSLFVSKSTVKTHLRRIYGKLLVKNRAEAVAIAHKFSLFSYDAS